MSDNGNFLRQLFHNLWFHSPDKSINLKKQFRSKFLYLKKFSSFIDKLQNLMFCPSNTGFQGGKSLFFLSFRNHMSSFGRT